MMIGDQGGSWKSRLEPGTVLGTKSAKRSRDVFHDVRHYVSRFRYTKSEYWSRRQVLPVDSGVGWDGSKCLFGFGKLPHFHVIYRVFTRVLPSM